MVDIYSCWHCGSSLLNREKTDNLLLSFHCNTKCLDNYNKKVAERQRSDVEWSNFMCFEGPCPKEYEDLARAQDILEDNGWLKTAENRTFSEEDGGDYEASMKHSSSKTSSSHVSRLSKRKNTNPLKEVFGKRKCGKCGALGHNARTCKDNYD